MVFTLVGVRSGPGPTRPQATRCVLLKPLISAATCAWDSPCRRRPGTVSGLHRALPGTEHWGLLPFDHQASQKLLVFFHVTRMSSVTLDKQGLPLPGPSMTPGTDQPGVNYSFSLVAPYASVVPA